MTIAGQTMTVTQAGAPCNYAISPTVASLGPEAATNTVAVTASAGCAWTASESASWITITSGASGSGNGTVTYSVTANPTITVRNAVMTIAGQSFDVTQGGQTCTYTLTPAGASVPATTTTGTVDVAALGGCAWTATSSAAWVTITSGASGSGNGTVGYSVAANPTTSSRTATLTIGGQSFTITQAAAPCTYAATPATHSIPAPGGPATITLTTQAGCNWTATTSAPWITISGTGTGTGSGTVDFVVAANPDGLGRSGTIAIGAQIVTVSQAAATCTYTFSPASVSVGSDLSTGSFSVAANNGCAWTATSSAPWLTITSGASGSGNGTLAYSVAANPNLTARTATISAGGQTFTVTQAAMVCSTTISPTASSPNATGGPGTVAVTANAASCAWTAASNASWITITAGASGSGSGTVSYSVAANASMTVRSGTMTIAGQTMTVTQAGAGCNYSISPTLATLGPSASTNTIAVTSPAGCAWTATESASWLTITNGASGSGNGTVTYSALANAATSPRSAVITVAGQSFNLTQTGQTCAYTLTPAGSSVPPAASTGSVAVGTISGCIWTAASLATWVTITSGVSGSGDGTVGYSVAANPTTSPRTGTLTIAGQPYTITQGAATCSYAVSPTTQPIGASGGPGTVTLTTQVGCAWSATTSAPWVTISGTGTGSGSGTIGYTVAANPDAIGRSGTIAVGGQIVTITQAAATCSYTLSPTSVSVGSDAATGSFSVAAASGCAWTAASGAAWLTITSTPGGSGNGTIAYSVAANTTAVVRSAAIVVGGRTFTVTQAAPGCTFTLSSTSLSVPSGASTGTVSVTSGAGCAWTAVSADPWITVTAGAAGTGSGVVSLSFAANTGSGSRTGTLTIAGQTVTVTQQSASCSTTISPSSVTAPDTATNGTVNVTSGAGCAWTAASNAAWMTIDSGATGTGPGAVAYTIAENTATTGRTGSMTIGGQTFTVTQSGRSCLATFNPSSTSVAATGGSLTVDVTTGAGCNWTASTSQPWISITSGGTGTGAGTIGFDVQANTGVFVRAGTISVGTRIFQISQAGACAYSMSPVSVSTGAAATTSSVFVFTAIGCSWTAASNDPWLSVTSSPSASGSGTVTLSTTTNNTGTTRTGTATIAGQTFTMTQSACTYGFSPTAVSPSASGTTSNVFISTAATCDWSASSNVSWITMPDGNTGAGASWLTYTVAPNPDTTPRTGAITIAGQALTVNQAATACTFSVSPTVVDVAKAGGTATVTVDAAAGCSWTVQNSLNWVTVTPAQGTGNGSVTLQIAANPLAFPRSAQINVAGELVIINQTNADGLNAPVNPRIVVQ
jgi:Viral BACON domain/Putative binding domain, N-terminal